MKFYIVVSESAFEKLPIDEEKTGQVTLLVDNAIRIPDTINKQYHVVPLLIAPEPSDKKACAVFTEEFQKNKCFTRYSTDIEPNINGIYEYVISSINDILFTLESVCGENDDIYLFGGNKKLKIAACYAVKSPEFNKNVFFDRADVLNPFLYEALSQQHKNIHYYESPFIYSLSKYLARVSILFCYSFIFTFIKYIVGCVKTKDHEDSVSNQDNNKYIIFPVRSNPQLDFSDPIASKLVSLNTEVKPIVFYYEMLLGSSFFHRFAHCNYSFITLFKFKYIGILFLLPVLIIWNMVRCYSFLKNRSPLSLSSGRYVYTMPLSFLAFENIAAPHVFFYEIILNKAILSFKSKKKTILKGYAQQK